MAKAKKSFGQHFLVNEGAAQRIADSLSMIDMVPRVIEVGPGKGMLTKYLLEKNVHLKVVEADRDMVEHLAKHYPQLEEVIHLDFLKLNMEKVFDGEPFLLIGNYPYNISSQIIFKMLQYRELIPEMVGMFQKEVSDRIIAPHGNKVYGVISVLTQAYYGGETIIKVQPGSFNPPPKVMSSVIRLVRKDIEELDCDPSAFKAIVKISFNQRRKMLRNTLKGMVHDESVLQHDDFNNRPDQLSLEDFTLITKYLQPFLK